MMKTKNYAIRFGATFGVALLALTGCTAGGGTDSPGSEQQSVDSAPEAAAVSIEEAWVKSAEAGGMSGAFGILSNSSDEDVNVVSVESAATPVGELHEVVDGTMREVDGGFVIPAEGTFELVPGGNHLMLMELPEALSAGEDVEFTLTFADGSTFEFSALVKDYAGANEDYGDLEHGEDHSHEDHEH